MVSISNAQRGGEPRSDWLLPGLSILLVGLIYLLTWPQNFTEAEDAVYYVDHVAGAVPQWHPNHLLYEPMMLALTRIVHGVGLPVPALVVMQLASFVAALWTLALIWRIARLAGGGLWAMSASVWLVAGCFAFWLYAMMPDTYLLPLPFVLASVVALWQAGWRGGGAQAAVYAGMLAALATLLHQSHVFLAPVALAVLLARRQWGGALAYLAVFGLMVGVGYLWAGWLLLGHHTIPDLMTWARGYAADGLWTPLSVLAPVKAVIGLGTAIWSSLFLFAIPEASARIEAVFPGRMLLEEYHFAATGLAIGPIALGVITAVSVLAVLGLIGLSLRRGGVPVRLPGLRGLLGLHALVYAGVVAIWEPTNKEFWIAVLPFAVLFLVLRLDGRRSVVRRVMAVAVVTLWLVNGLGAMLGMARTDSDYWRVTQAGVLAEAGAGDVVVDDCGYICTGYLLAFSPADLLPAEEIGRAADIAPGRIIVTERARIALEARPVAGWSDISSRLRELPGHDRLPLYSLPR